MKPRSPGRAECRGCGEQRALRWDGKIRKHQGKPVTIGVQTLRFTCQGSGRIPTTPPIVCTGRAVDDATGTSTGPICGRSLKARFSWALDSEETSTQLAQRARAGGWKLAPDGNAICPSCAKPDPVTVALCRELTVDHA